MILKFNPDAIATTIREVAEAEILPRYCKLQAGDTREKKPGDVVTIADEQAEAVLGPRLQDLLPGSIVIGEEATARDPDLLHRLSGDQPAWIIDPVDGTANFAEGKPDFCTMVALAHHDEVIAGWIYVPLQSMSAVAVKGEGVSFTGQRLEGPIPEKPDRGGVVAVGQRGGPDLVKRAQALRSQITQTRSSRCAGIDYLKLAQGELNFTLFSGVMPWDHAPGVAIIRELGGRCGCADGRPYQPSRSLSANGVLAARDEAVWNDVLKRLYPERIAR